MCHTTIIIKDFHTCCYTFINFYSYKNHNYKSEQVQNHPPMQDQSQQQPLPSQPPSQPQEESSVSSDLTYKEQNNNSEPQEEIHPIPANPPQLQARKQRYKQNPTQDRSIFLNKIMCEMQLYFNQPNLRRGLNQFYNHHSVIGKYDEDRVKYSKIFEQMLINKIFDPALLGLDTRQSRGVGAVLGMGIGDALGSCTEFHHFNKEGLGIIKNGFEDLKSHSRSGKVTVWTDDASMGLCMADSILLNDYVFNPTHMRYLFVLWLQHGLNNGGRPYSIGLGGNISISMYEFQRVQAQYTARGDRFNNGNGSLMRLAPVPVAYAHDLQKGIEYSGKQSLTTHNGLQAEQCSKLMANIIIQLINRNPATDGKELILKVCDSFKSPAESVVFLARSQQESEEYYQSCCQKNPKFKSFNKVIEDRNWNWRSKEHTYSPTRLRQQPGYIGSYCMDALAMALHTVMFTESFAEVVIKNADMGGDCDTVGSIAGQIAGALYGVDEGMLRLYSEMEDFTEGCYQVFLKGYKLINRKILQ